MIWVPTILAFVFVMYALHKEHVSKQQEYEAIILHASTQAHKAIKKAEDELRTCPLCGKTAKRRPQAKAWYCTDPLCSFSATPFATDESDTKTIVHGTPDLNQCAECSGWCSGDDYLCRNCRYGPVEIGPVREICLSQKEGLWCHRTLGHKGFCTYVPEDELWTNEEMVQHLLREHAHDEYSPLDGPGQSD